jgi:uncharacterized protein
MRSLLDINFLIALFDPDHVFHDRSHEWWGGNHDQGWASCPLTENGVVRIVSNPRYSKLSGFSPHDLILNIRTFIKQTDHVFWSDDLSILDENVFVADRILGPGQLTDIYLLALSAKNRGRLITFDQSIPLTAVNGATPENICVV